MQAKVLPLRKKIKFEDVPTEWSHHRGGWSFVIQQLQSLQADDGILCVSAVEEWIFKEKVISQPWIGFVHQVIQNNCRWYPDLERLVKNSAFLQSLDNCHGLFVLSQVSKEYLTCNLQKSVPVVRILYPATPFPKNLVFDWRRFKSQDKKRILHVGKFLRNYQAFFDLAVPPTYQKCLLKCPDVDFNRLFDCSKTRIELKQNDSVAVKERVSDQEFDNLLSSSIVFINLYDAMANTTVVECLSRNTPILINRLAGVEEYLGSSYPLFYNTLEEASKMICNDEILQEASKYLKMRSENLQILPDNFVQSFMNSAVYRTLPLPDSQKTDPRQTKFPRFDVTVMLISYKRVYNLEKLLKSFRDQDFTGNFEMIVWNNNVETQEELKNICNPFMKDLNITLIQSSQNYYCIVRLAAMRLMQSDILLVCDDDIVPEPNYISLFVSKFKEYGPNAVICCRGHVFKKHSLNEEQPEQLWENYNNFKFFNESVDDRQVRFL